MKKLFIYVASGILISMATPSFAQAKVTAYINLNPLSWFYPTYRVVKVRPPVRRVVHEYRPTYVSHNGYVKSKRHYKNKRNKYMKRKYKKARRSRRINRYRAW